MSRLQTLSAARLRRGDGKIMSTLLVSVNGETLDTFESGSVTLSMMDAVNHFEVEYVARPLPGQRLINRGDRVEIAFDHGNNSYPDVVIEGHVDATNDRDTADALTFRVSGRSAVQDLSDCSATSPDTQGPIPKVVPLSWKGGTLDGIVSDLCGPFPLGTFVDRPGAAFNGAVSVQSGERVIDAIQRLALKRGLLAYSVGGDLVLARAGTTTTNTVLERGVNVVEWEYSQSDYNRFSEYRLYAQARPTDDNWGEASSQISTIVKDPEIKRYRPLAIHCEANDGLELRTRGLLERNVRMGQGRNLTALVVGWQNAEGYAWRPNTLVAAKNDVLGINATLIITTARFRFGPNEPSTVQLEMTRPEAFDTEAVYEEIEKEEAAQSKRAAR